MGSERRGIVDRYKCKVKEKERYTDQDSLQTHLKFKYAIRRIVLQPLSWKGNLLVEGEKSKRQSQPNLPDSAVFDR